MNRILFRAVVAFALGEVVESLSYGIWKIGIAIAMSIFSAIIYVAKKRGNKKRELHDVNACDDKMHIIKIRGFAYVVLFLLGYINMLCNDIKPSVEECALSKNASNTNQQEFHSQNYVQALYGSVVECKEYEKSTWIKLKVERTVCTDKADSGETCSHAHSDVYYCMLYTNEAVSLGDYIEVTGDLEKITNSNNPGAYDEKSYYAGMNINYKLSNIQSVDVVGKGKLSLKEKLEKEVFIKLRENLKNKLYTLCDKKYADIYSGILLGDKSNISEDTKLLYKRGGIGHILAISSLHMTLIGGLIWKLLQLMNLSVYKSGVVATLLMLLYGLMTGFSVATIRAIIMMGLGVLARIHGRRYDIVTAMSVALATVLVFEPELLKDSATIMSFMAIGGVAIGRYVIKNIDKNEKIFRIKKQRKKLYAIITALVYQTSLQVVMLPVLVNNYYEIYPYSFVVNLIVVPLMSVVLISGMVGLIVAYVMPSVGQIIIGIGCVTLSIFEKLCKLSTKLPLSNLNVGHMSKLEVAIYYLFVALIVLNISQKMNRKIRDIYYEKTGKWFAKKKYLQVKKVVMVVCTMITILLEVIIHQKLNQPTNVFLDVGQGTGILIKEDDINIAIDGGSVSEKNVGQYVIVPAIKYYGMSNIDYWFVSHGDADHVNGLIYIMEKYDLLGIKIKHLVLGINCKNYKQTMNLEEQENIDKLHELARKNKIPIIYMAAGDYISGDAFSISCYHPSKNKTYDNVNDESLCIDYVSREFSALFLGDVSEAAVADMLTEMLTKDAGPKLKYDIIQVPHHGSKYSVSNDLYKMLNEDGVAVISCGYNYYYGHPHKEVLELLSRYKINVKRTDLEGAIKLKNVDFK